MLKVSSALSAALAGLAVTGCAWWSDPAPHREASDDDCKRAPTATAFVYREGKAGGRFSGEFVIEEISKHRVRGFVYRLKDEHSGNTHDLVYEFEHPVPALQEGSRYRFDVETVFWWPRLSSLVIHDQHGLLFADIVDKEQGEIAHKNRIDGFTLRLGQLGCADRGGDPCLDAQVNVPVEVNSAEGTLTLYHGDAAILGRYEVRIILAQRVRYSNRCVDSGVPGLSYRIRRVAPGTIRVDERPKPRWHHARAHVAAADAAEARFGR